jgi:TP901 family phage tail tape measure protein
MADENIVTNIVAKADFSNLIGDLNKVSFSLTKLQDQLVASNKMLAAQVGVMNRSFADTLRSTGQFSTHFVSLSSDVEKFGSQLDRGQMRLGKFFQVYRQHATSTGGLVRDLAKQQVQLQNAIMQPLGKNAQGLMQYNVHIPRGLDLVKNKALIARQELQIMNKVVQEGANSLINWGKNTQWAGRQLTVGLTVPLAAFGKAAADAFREADQELVRLTKVYGDVAGTSAEDLSIVRKEVIQTSKEISAAMGVNFKETIGLAADIAATGKTGNELLGSLRETTRLAVLGEVDRQEAMKATLAIQTAFKQNTEELAESINFLNAVENQTSTTLNDLVEAIPKAGPVIQGLGGDVQDLALYLTAMREGGINASEGANALKSGLASMINPTKQSVGLLRDFGVDILGIVGKNAGNTTGMLMDLQSALDNIDPFKKAQAIEQLFGKFQFSRISALLNNLGREGSQTLQVLDLMKASSQELGTVADRELAAVTESASGKYRRAVEGLKADLAGIGEQFLKINTSLINFIDGIIKFVQKLPDPIKQALGFMGMLTAAAGPLIMLTGVLGNFFGYIIKGAYHFKSLFKGGEGWKLLTPEILAAQKAGNLVEQTFYSDAKAAAVLKQAIAGLTAEFTILQQKASSAAMSINPAIATTAGNVIVAGPRVVNPNHPLVGKMDTRAAAHHNPRGLMNQAQRDAQTIHSVTPGSIDVNQKIGTVPQIFMAGDMPKIEGLTSSRGASTGIVAQEAAKWHALMGSLSMLSKREVATLKKEIARTGTFSEDISNTFNQLLVPMTDITTNAANRSAQIVAQLQSGKITMEAARAKIIALNTEIEAMMAAATTQVATSLGRTANLTQVPLTSQAIVSNTGKANLKEIFRPGRKGKTIVDTIARALGVRTYGAGYSTETTMPKKFATGGMVVPGPRSDTTDTQFMNLIEGDVVLNRKASDALMGYNKGGRVVPAMVTPGEIIVNNPTPAEAEMLLAYNNQFAVGGRVMASKNNYGIPSLVAKYAAASKMFSGFRSPGTPYYRASRGVMDRTGSTTQSFSEPGSPMRFNDYRLTKSSVYKDQSNKNYGITPTVTGQTLTHAYNPSFVKRLKQMGYGPDDNIPVDVLKSMGVPIPSGAKYVTLKALSSTWVKTSKRFNEAIKSNLPETNKNGTGWRDNWEPAGPESMQSLLIKLKSMNVMPIEAGRIAEKAAGRLNGFVKNHKGPMTELAWGRYVNAAEMGAINDIARRSHSAQLVAGVRSGQQNRYNKEDSDLLAALNMGGTVKGYNLGGVVGKTLGPKFKSQLNKKLGITWGQGLAGDGLTNNPPTSGYGNLALQIGMGKKLFGGTGLTPRAQNLMYDALASELEQTTPDTYIKMQGARGSKLVRAMAPSQTDGMLFGAASTVARHRGISKKDREILALWSSDPFKNNYPKGLLSKITGKMFGYNRGGMVSMPPQIPIPAQDGKYNMGGMVKGYQEGGPVSAFTTGLRNPYGKSLVSGGMNMPQMGMGAQMGIGMGGMMAGSMVGGPAGMGIMLASNILPMMSGLRGLGGLLPTITKLAGVLGKLTIPGAVIGGAFMLGKYLLDIKKNAEDAGKANRLAFGGTQESFASVGITKFKTLSDRMKEVNEQIDLNKAKAQSAYEAYTRGGPTGITLSIKELNEAIENAKKNQTEYVEAFNNIDSSKVNKYAADLKAQFVAMGLSASEASNQIYAMIKASDKASQSLSAVSTSDFKSITDQTSALTRLFDNLGKASTVANFNPEEFAAGLDTLISSVLSYQQGLIGTKDALDPKNIIDSAEALRITMEKITKINSANAKLTTDQINKLKEQNVVYASILGNLESTASVTAKILLYNNEIGDLVDLSAISGDSAITMAKNLAAIQEGVNAITESSGKNNPLKALADPINKAKAASVSYAKSIQEAKKQDEDYYSNKIKAIDLEIKKINEAANARKKALQEQQDAENYDLEIKKKQIEYQNALASGDMAAAARAQLDIQQMVKQRQIQNASNAIDDKREADLKIQEDKKQKVRDAEDRFNKGVQTSMAKATETTANLASLENKMDRLEKLSILYTSATDSSDKQNYIKQAQALILEMKSGSKEEKQAALDFEKQYNTPKPTESLNVYGAPSVKQESLNLYGASQATTGQKVLDAMAAEMKAKGLSDKAFATAVSDFKTAVDKFKGNTGRAIEGKAYGTISPNALDYLRSAMSGELTPAENAMKLIRKEGLKAGDVFSYDGSTFRVDKGGKTLTKLAMGGYVRNYQMGSFGGVRGPGTSTSDSIPAMLSNGEYVLRASAVNSIGVPLLDEINKMAMGGLAARYDVSKKMAMPSNTMGYNRGGPIQNYNVGGLTMNFADGGEVNGRMLYEQFKGAMALDRLKTGGGGRLV